MSPLRGNLACIYICKSDIFCFTPSILIHRTLSLYKDLVAVTSIAYLLARRTPTPSFSAASGFIQFFSPGVAFNIQLAHPDISLEPKFSNFFPLSLCSCIMIISTFGVKELRKSLFLAMLSGSLRPRMLCIMIFHFIRG